MHTKRLGDMLLETGLITEEQLGEALKYQAQEKERLGTTPDPAWHRIYRSLEGGYHAGNVQICTKEPGEKDECGSGPCFQGSALSGDGGSIELHGDRGGKAHLKKEDRADDRVGTGGETCHQCFIRK